MTILIRGGHVMTPDGWEVLDVVVDGDVVAAVGQNLEAPQAEVVDAAGCWVGPGFVDLHVHLREPGHEWKEDIASGTAAAAAGGYTLVVAMPNTDPPIDSGHLARFVAERARLVGRCDVQPAGCITLGRAGEFLAHLDELWDAGVRIFTDDGDGVADAGLLRHAMEYLAERGGVVAQHPEDPGLARGGHMHEGSVSARLGMAGLPALAEELMVARDLALVRETGVRYHVQHVSTKGTVELVAQAKADGLAVTAEVTPHHLTFDHTRVETMDPDYKMYPPLRTAEDVAALREAVRDGTIDAIATDHAPHAAHEREVPFEEAPRGVIGLETAFAAALAALGADRDLLFQRMSVAPARISGADRHGRPVEPGIPANLVVVDPAARWTPQTFVSRAENSPWRGVELTGRAVATIQEGRLTHRDVVVG